MTEDWFCIDLPTKGGAAHAHVSPEVAPETVAALARCAELAFEAIMKGEIGMGKSDGEEAFAAWWKLLAPFGVGLFRQFQYDQPNSKRAFDFANPFARVAVEIEGGMHPITTKNGKVIKGHHVHPEGYAEDCARYNEAQERGWLVLRFTPEMIERDPTAAVEQVARVIQARLP